MVFLNHGIIVSIILFFIGIFSLLIHNNLIYILISLELLTNSIMLMIILIGHYWGQSNGQVFYIFIITSAATEVSILLAMFVKIYRRYHTLDIYKLSETHK